MAEAYFLITILGNGRIKKHFHKEVPFEKKKNNEDYKTKTQKQNVNKPNSLTETNVNSIGHKTFLHYKKSQTSFVLRKITQLRLQANTNPNSPEGSRSIILEKCAI